MTKADVFTAGTQRDHIPDLHHIIGHHDPSNEEFDQLSSLLKRGLRQALLHPTTEIVDRGDQAGQFGLPIDVDGQLACLLFQSGHSLLKVDSSPLILDQGITPSR